MCPAGFFQVDCRGKATGVMKSGLSKKVTQGGIGEEEGDP